MFNQSHYVPILKAKDGEFDALAAIPSSIRSTLTPILEITPPTKKRTWEQHLDSMAKKAARSLESQLFLVDARWLVNAPAIANRHALEYFCSYLFEMGCSPVPVTQLRNNVAYQNAVRDCHMHMYRGFAVRLEAIDFANTDSTNQQIDSLLSLLQLTPSDLDLIIDFRSISAEQAPYLVSIITLVLNSIDVIPECRSLAFTASSFPYDLSNIESQSINDIPRVEWAVWNELRKNADKLSRMPSFGDYAVSHPELPEDLGFPPNRAAQIRYTLDETWRIYKGYGIRTPGKGGSDQIYTLCRHLVNSDVYYGKKYSEGDQYIYNCAEETDGPGNGTTWRRVGASHHITIVLNQLSSLFDS